MNQKKLYFAEETFLLFFSYQITQNRKKCEELFRKRRKYEEKK